MTPIPPEIIAKPMLFWSYLIFHLLLEGKFGDSSFLVILCLSTNMSWVLLWNLQWNLRKRLGESFKGSFLIISCIMGIIELLWRKSDGNLLRAFTWAAQFQSTIKWHIPAIMILHYGAKESKGESDLNIKQCKGNIV